MNEVEFAQFVAGSTSRLRATAYVLTGDSAEADDLTQQLYERLWKAWRRRGAPENPYGYARTALVRTHVSTRRRLRWSREGPLDDRYGQHDATRASDGPEERAAARSVIEAALSSLTPRQRQVVSLRFLEDLSVETTAEILGVRSGTVKRATADALQRLRDAQHLIAPDSSSREPHRVRERLEKPAPLTTDPIPPRPHRVEPS